MFLVPHGNTLGYQSQALPESFTFSKKPSGQWTQGVEFNLRNFTTIWFCSKTSGDPYSFTLQIFEFDPGKSDPRPKVLTAFTRTIHPAKSRAWHYSYYLRNQRTM